MQSEKVAIHEMVAFKHPC